MLNSDRERKLDLLLMISAISVVFLMLLGFFLKVMFI